jgi:glycosyltransferase involved in cell wall biosynthesis
MKKLVYLTSARIPDEWAHVVQILTMCDAFADAGAEVMLVAPRRARTQSTDPYVFAGIPHSFQICKLPCLDLFAGTTSRVLFWVRAISFLLFALPFLILKRRPFVYTREPLLACAALSIGCRVWWEAHTADTNIFATYAGRGVEKVVCISQGLKDFYSQRGVSADRLMIENDAVSLESFEGLRTKHELRDQYSLPQNAQIIAYVGKYKPMGHSKGVEEVIESVANIAKTNPEVFLLLVGLYPEEIAEVTTHIESRGLPQERYKLVTHVPKPEVPNYLRTADILVMSYPNTPYAAHMMSPLKMYEYMASGVPIVSSDLPTIREALNKENAYLVAPDSVPALMDGIAHVLRDPAYGARIALQAHTDVQTHTWKVRAARILQAASIITGTSI